MKLIVSIVVIIGLIALGLIIYDALEHKSPPKFNELAQPIMRDQRAVRLEPVRQAQQVATNAQSQQQRPPAQSTQMKRGAFERMAQAHRVRIVNYQESGNTATISLEWGGDNATLGADFLDGALRGGLARDFDDLHKGQALNRQQQRVWQATYRLKW